jgi:cyclin-dependent kinase 7
LLSPFSCLSRLPVSHACPSLTLACLSRLPVLAFYIVFLPLRSVTDLLAGKKLGEGTFAIVYRGHLRSNPNHLIAIKKFKIPSQPEQRSEGLNVDSIREIKYLQELSHPSIVGLLDVFSTKDETINMVIEYFPNGNLEQLIKDRSVAYGAADVKAWMGMLGRAIYFCHSNFVLHRDIKPNNLLIAADGEVKLADFGLARSFADPYANMTHVVITLWYRPPELLFGARHYSGAVDVWSMGMVFAELLLRVPYAATMSDKEIAQLETICDAVGTPNEDNWPGVTSLPNYIEMDKQVPARGRDYYMSKFPTAGAQGVDLLMSMLKLDPRNRVSAKGVLEHAWWKVEPRPTDGENLPKQGGGAEKMGEDVARQPGVIREDERFQGVARRLDFDTLK